MIRGVCTQCGCAARELVGMTNSQCDQCYPETRGGGSISGCGCRDQRHARAHLDSRQSAYDSRRGQTPGRTTVYRPRPTTPRSR